MESLRRQGVATAEYVPCIHLQPYMRAQFGFSEGLCPVAEETAARTMALPFFSQIDPATRSASSRSCARHCRRTLMDVTSLAAVEPFTTKDGSLIRELQHTQAQSLAEAKLEPGQVTERHYHRDSEEIYFPARGNRCARARRTAPGRPAGRCGADPARDLAPDSRARAVALPLLLFPCVLPLGHVLRVRAGWLASRGGLSVERCGDSVLQCPERERLHDVVVGSG